ncbi:glycosyltransferase family 4 protein [Engelhardtia mirabilis]|uniref:GDP-mannose-dependent alpha-(1-2)-phosphatidylinositol mannosyltransferase n=1 Tax=Engelhardtia mirabilis TaxID=2528011 RepID=A0A518BDP9_9BACT|nr:GDP-mannose-dependent alpha-(1-2)-phosphatidylinositol mannosyltransferase [Planctomycetes bacterium Pla133]QDU99408.1 GDP-mannose-dependent alpha-(1-2)-phosphatidylinositol mannosyltransferase [Planctomycetes bacterium Pla86]
MRVAYVNQDPGVRPGKPKGAAVHVLAMRSALARAGAEVLAIDEADPDRLESQLAPELARGAIDLIYERYALGADRSVRLARTYGVPHLLEVNAPLILEAARYRGRTAERSDELLEAEIFLASDRVLCVSSALAEYVRQRSGGDATVVVEANAVDPAFLANPTPEPGFGTPGRLVLGFHGRLRPWHGFDRQVELASRLIEAGIDLELAIVGEGDFDAARTLPADRVVRAPWCAPHEVPAYVARFDLVALTYGPDAPEWFSPLKLAEAMAVGAVPLVADRGDLPQVVKDGESGRVLPAGDADAWFAAALELCCDARERARLAAGCRHAVAGLTWDAQAERALDVARDRSRTR